MRQKITAVAPLVLGSASPRRHSLLTQLQIVHIVHASSVDEQVRPGERSEAYLERIVQDKLRSVRAILPRDLAASALLVADTTVLDGDAILGKPDTDTQARSFLRRLASRAHEVHTRFIVGTIETGAELHAETVRTRVLFRPLSDEEIEAYVQSGEGRDKAGGYAVQGLGAAMVERIEGSYTNVVGLPASELVVALRGLHLL